MAMAGLGLEVAALGLATTWLLALVPAAIVSLLKNRLSLFFAGFLTLGLPWIVAAISLAPPDSWWARTFYGEERLARATDPLRHPRSRRTVALSLVGALSVALILGLLAARPTPILGVDGLSLGNSVGTGGLTTTDACRPAGDDTWTCDRYDDEVSGTVEYSVNVKGTGCWTATRIGAPGAGSSRRLSGCITVVDHLLS